MAITVAKLLVWVGAEVDNAVKGLNQVTGELNGFEKKARQVGRRMTLLVTAPILGAGAAAAKLTADFDQNMSVLAAQSNATGDELERLRQLAVQLGADMSLPGTSAADAAEAMLELSKAGLSVENTMQAARGVLQLSAAGQLSNARAAEVTANALNAFHLAGSEAVRVADLLAASANASSGEVTDMADALQMASAVAYSAGIPIEDLVTMISEMANAGIQGSDAGTSIKQMLLSLQAPTQQAANRMKELGIRIYDAQGNMLPMPAIIQQFSQALSGLSQEQRNAALATIFGSDAVRASNVILMSGTDAFLQMKDAVTEQGVAAKLAAAYMTGLTGAYENVVNAAENLLLNGFQPLKDDLAAFLNRVAETMNAMSQMPEGTLKITLGFLGFAAAIGPATWALGTFISNLKVLTGVLIGLPKFLGDVAAGLALIQGGAGAFSVATTGAAGLTAALIPLAASLAILGGLFVVAAKRNAELVNKRAALLEMGHNLKYSTQSQEEYVAALQEGLKGTNLMIDAEGNLISVRKDGYRFYTELVEKNFQLSDAERAAARASKAAAGEAVAANVALNQQLAAGSATFEEYLRRAQEAGLMLMGFSEAQWMAERAMAAFQETAQKSEAMQKLNQQFNDLSLYMSGPLGSELDRFNQRQQELKLRAAEARAEIEHLSGLSYLTAAQRAELQEARNQLNASNLAIAQNAAQHDQATQRILIDLMMQRLAMMELPEAAQQAGFQMINELAFAWGVIDQQTYQAVQSIDQAFLQLAQGNVQEARRQILGIGQAALAVSGDYYLRFHIQMVGPAKPGEAMPSLSEMLNKTVDSIPVTEISDAFSSAISGGVSSGLNKAGSAVNKFTKDMGHKLMDVASALSGLGSSAANLLRERALDPLQERIQQLKDDLGGLDDQLDEMERFSKLGWLNESELERLAELQAERAEKAAELASSEERVAEIEERLTRLREQQANLSFLEAQMRLLDTIRENGLNAGKILQGITLGLDADLEDLIDAMVRAMQAMIESAEDELGISSPSTVFRGIAQNIKDTVAEELGNTRQLEQVAANLAGSVSEAFDFRFDQAVGAFEPFQMDLAAASSKVLPATPAPPASAFQAAGGAGKTINYITVQAEIKRDLDRFELARDVVREIERRSK